MFAQGTINFANRVANAVSAPIYNVDPANPTAEKSGNPSAADLGFPAGTTVYGGAKLQGTGFSAQLWVGTDVDHLAPCTASIGGAVLTSTFRTGSGAGLLNTATAFAGLDAGTSVLAVLRVWDNQGGTILSYAEALAKNAATGSGGTQVALGGVSANGTIFANPNLLGLTSFQLHIVPEPSVIALGVLGLGALLLRRRK